MNLTHPGWRATSAADQRVHDVLEFTDWRTSALVMTDPGHRDIATRAVAMGAVVAYPYANIYVFSSRPDEDLVRYVNQVKGRPPEQTGSVVTTPERIAALFDWTRLPAGLEAAQVLDLIGGLIELGPFGFRGPAGAHLPHYLTADDNGVRTVQVVSPGVGCPSNRLFAQVLTYIPEGYLYGTSANRSRQVTGAEDEPVHYRLAPVQAGFGAVPGFFMIRSADECATQQGYPRHAPMSATLLSFHKLGPAEGALPRLVVERYGSLELAELERVAAHAGVGLFLAPTARRRLAQRDYAADLAPELAPVTRAA